MENMVCEYFLNTNRSSKSRKASLSSLLADKDYDPKVYHDKLSIRKLAKACSRSLWNCNDHSSNRKPSSTTETELLQDSSKLDTFSILQSITRRHKSKAHGMNGNTADSSAWKNYFDAKYQPTSNQSNGDSQDRTTRVLEPSKSLNIQNGIEMKNEDTNYQVRENASHSEILTYKNDSVRMMDSFNLAESTVQEEIPYSQEGKRIIQMRNFPSAVGIKSVIAQVGGGPLEKVVVLNSNDDQSSNLILELWFLKDTDALQFLNYSYTGLCLVNGFNVSADWGPASKDCRLYHTEPDKSVEEEMEINGASRCLILKKYINKKATNKKTYPSPLKNYSNDLNINDIWNHFGKFGPILEISPVISKKLCIAIHFYSAECAIAAKREFDAKSTELYETYKAWSLWYGKDPCDKPCLNV